jgi:hypothetical protein
MHFGLGTAGAAERVEVRWLDGTTSVETDVSGNRYLVVEKGPS